jgi:hypothetical protein
MSLQFIFAKNKLSARGSFDIKLVRFSRDAFTKASPKVAKNLTLFYSKASLFFASKKLFKE